MISGPENLAWKLAQPAINCYQIQICHFRDVSLIIKHFPAYQINCFFSISFNASITS